MVSIRYYKDSDYEEIKQVLQEGNLYDDVWEARQNLKQKIIRDPQSILIAEENNHVIGCVFIVEDGWTAFIWRLSVRKEYRKKGVGLMLMQKAEEIVRTRGIKELSLFADTKNTLLKEWYQKQKYIKTSDYTFMYKKLS